MAYLIVAQNIQKLEYDVTTAEGSSRVTVVTGMLPQGLQAYSNNAATVTQSYSLRTLVDPKLSPGQFRKAAALAAITDVYFGANATPASYEFGVQEVEATFDDESGQIVLRVDVTVQAMNGSLVANKLNFQVTTLSINLPNNPP